MKVLFLTQTGPHGASARYRVYQYLDYIKASGIEFYVSPAIPDGLLEKYCNSNNYFTKVQFYATQIIKRLRDIQKVSKFDIIFMQRDLVVHIYPFLEKLIALFNKRIIFDFDDAIYLYPTHKKTGLFFKLLWDRKKIKRIIGLSKHVIAGNNFLKEYSEKFTKNVSVIPTSIDLNLYRLNKPKTAKISEVVNIGWMGSQGTFSYLEDIFPVFEELAKKYNIELTVIGAKGSSLDGVRVNYKDWSLDKEIDDINCFDIGVMPLVDDEWSRGKCGTKLLQYMAAGVPAVGSPVGVNIEIINNGVTGLLAQTREDWVKNISLLIEDQGLRSRLVNNARNHVDKFYSVQANAPKFLEIIKRVALGS